MGRLLSLMLVCGAVLTCSFLLTACGDSGTPPPTPASMSTYPSSVTGIVGQSASISVTVTGSDSQPYAGGVVSFSVTSGGGSVSPPSATTDQSGRAFTTWTLGQAVGAQQLTASLSGVSVTVQATALAGAPASIQAMNSFPGTFDPGTVLAQPAVFQVEDEYGNGVSGASVSFTASDGGSANPASTTTDSQGRASTAWTLGPNNGVQALSAAVGAVTPATVQAEAYDPCQDVQTLTIGGTVQGNLSSSSCEFEVNNALRFSDWYQFTLAAAGAFVFTVQSDFQGPAFWLYDTGGLMGGLISDDNDVVYRAFLDVSPLTTSGQANATTSETYRAGVFSSFGGVGNYTHNAVASSGQMQNCERWVSTGSLVTNQTLSLADDCNFTSGRQGHWITVYLEEGEGIAISHTSTAFDPLVYVWGSGWEFLVSDDDGGTGANAYLEFTADASGYYYITPTTYNVGEVGAYTLTLGPLVMSSPKAAPGSVKPRAERNELHLPPATGPEAKVRDDSAVSRRRKTR